MAEYWKKEDVLKAVDDLRINTVDPKVDYAFCRLQEMASKYLWSVIPAADVVERKRGEWKLNAPDDFIVYCPECMMPQDSPCNFCQSCGADMRGKT